MPYFRWAWPVILALAAVAGCGETSTPVVPAVGGTPATAASVRAPEALAFDRAGNLYVSEFEGARVVRLDPTGRLARVAGTGREGYAGDGGPATAAELNKPTGLAFAADGALLIADHRNDVLRRVDLDGAIHTIARGLDDPIGIAVDGDRVIVADELHARVVAIDDAGAITVLVGGSGLSHPSYLVLDADGRIVFSDFQAKSIRRIEADGTLTRIAGDLDFPTGLAFDRDGNLTFSESGSNRVRQIDRDGTIRTIAGTGEQGALGDGGPAAKAQLNGPAGLAFDKDGTLFIADQGNNRVRRVGLDGVITTVAGTGS